MTVMQRTEGGRRIADRARESDYEQGYTTVNVAPSERIISGELVIVRCEGKHDVLPRDIAERIRAYDARAVIGLQDAASAPPSEDDPYKDYVVPDDLKW